MLEEYKHIKANQGVGGIDGVEFDELERDLRNDFNIILNRMSSGSYIPIAVKGEGIPKKDGRKRHLGILTITDMIAQMVVLMNFESLVESCFIRIRIDGCSSVETRQETYLNSRRQGWGRSGWRWQRTK